MRAGYRRWWAERRVDGVLIVDQRVDDPRIGELVRLGLPTVLVGGPVEGGGIPSVWHEEHEQVADTVRYLAALGHSRVARVGGGDDYTPESSARATRTLLRTTSSMFSSRRATSAAASTTSGRGSASFATISSLRPASPLRL
jgi:DNA-binding LacI/PurR family transcriptional regulator